MKRVLLSTVFILFLCSVLILQVFGGMIRAAISPKVEVIRPQIYSSEGKYIDRAVPIEAVYSDESEMKMVWLAVSDDSSGEKCYIAKKEYVLSGDILGSYISIHSLGVTSLVILTDPTHFTEGQRVEIVEAEK